MPDRGRDAAVIRGAIEIVCAGVLFAALVVAVWPWLWSVIERLAG